MTLYHARYMMAASCMLLGALGLGSVGTGCSTTDPAARESSGSLDRASFPPVADLYQRRCGSLECHGSTYRNFRLYGLYGHRLDGTHKPDAPDTTVAEYDASYQAFLGLEPQILREVIAGGGVDATRLTVVRKGRGEEAHKGGIPVQPGSAADKCILGWIRNVPDAVSCKAALKSP